LSTLHFLYVSSNNCLNGIRVSVNSIIHGSASWFMLYVKHYENSQMSRDELGGACSKHVREEKCMKISGLDSK
jgi:hypothetical protein